MYDHIDVLDQFGIKLAGEAQLGGAQLGTVHRDLGVTENATSAHDLLHSKCSLMIVVGPYEADDPFHDIGRQT
jgi:hypothetical protein